MRINFKTENKENFKGYKNIIANSMSKNKTRLYSITMQLDNLSKNDLTTWHTIQEKLGFKANTLQDIISFIVLESEKAKSFFFLSDLSNPITFDNVKKSSELENIYLKIYTLVASLTKRLSNDRTLTKDSGFNKSCTEVYKTYKNFLNGESDKAFLLTKIILEKKEPPQQVAGRINNNISKIMKDYFT